MADKMRTAFTILTFKKMSTMNIDCFIYDNFLLPFFQRNLQQMNFMIHSYNNQTQSHVYIHSSFLYDERKFECQLFNL